MNTDSLIDFPCLFPIKIIGDNSSVFFEEIVAIVRVHYPDLNTDLITKNPSKDANYLALTVSVYAQNKETLDALYQDITKHPHVKMVL